MEVYVCGLKEKQPCFLFLQSVHELVLGEMVRRNLLLKVCRCSSLLILSDECVRRLLDAGKPRAIKT